jgi:diguanylate cyclase (GGDEF)-like protein
MIRKVSQHHVSGDEFANPGSRNLLVRLLDLMVDGFNCLAMRLFIAFTLAILLSAGVTDLFYPYMFKGVSEKLVAATALSFNSKTLTNATMDACTHRSGCSWCYITGSNSKNTVLYHSSFLPSGALPVSVNPQVLTIENRRYFQVVAHLNNGSVLHMGFPLVDSFLPKLLSGDLQNAVLSAQQMLILLCGTLAFLFLALEVWVGRPLNRLAYAARSIVALRNTFTLTAGSLDVSGAVTEVQKVRDGLIELRQQYDELNSARTAVDGEMRRLKSSYEKEKSTLVTNFKQQLANSQQKLSEFYTKEVEEEFLNSLVRELDLIRSSQQLCDRVLEKVNNRYPSSVMYGAFFKVFESLNYELFSHLAFDAPSIQMLRKTNHFRIAQQVFSSGQHLHLTLPAMQEYGLAALAEHNGINHVIYMPLIFQQHNLGIFAFYIVPETADIQELLRTLRSVCDIAARSLYQLLMYEEATMAARTDLLTDLPNRKFLEEIFPIILERASVSATPVSAIVIHPDQLRSIAENSGRVAVDHMLKELARVLKDHITSSPLTQEQETHLIRFDTEDFVLILDRADTANATAIAKQIEDTIESRSTWPGGIAAVTVSQGIASYPTDGNTPTDLINMSEAALRYGRETLGTGHIFSAQAVPEEYLSTKSVAMDGNLSVFDAGGLLQSVATSQKTGILTVESSNGKQLWTLFEMGKPTQARLGRLKAENALVEFMVGFADGVFNFQETAHTQSSKLPKLDDSYNIKSSLDRIVLDGALAQDNYRKVLHLIPALETVVVPADLFNSRRENLAKLSDPPTPKEYEVMAEIVKHADGTNSLAEIFRLLESIPSYLLWYSCAILLREELLVPVNVTQPAASSSRA